jgi:hypothetical protein
VQNEQYGLGFLAPGPSCVSAMPQLIREWSRVASLSPSQLELCQQLKYIARAPIFEFESPPQSGAKLNAICDGCGKGGGMRCGVPLR